MFFEKFQSNGNGGYSGSHATLDGSALIVHVYAEHPISMIAQAAAMQVVLKIDRILERSRALVAELSSNGGIYHEKMIEYIEYVLTECKGFNLRDFVDAFGKICNEISVDDFISKLIISSMSIDLDLKSIVVDFKYDETVDELWVVRYDLALSFVEMTCES